MGRQFRRGALVSILGLTGCQADPAASDAALPDAALPDAAPTPDIGTPAACEALRPIAVRACARPDPRPTTNQPSGDVAIRGKVGALEHGLWDCGWPLRGNPYPELGGAPWTFQVTDADDATRVVLVGLLADGVEPPVSAGETVSVDYQVSGGGWGPEVGALTLRDADGRLLLWTGEAGTNAELPTPDEIQVGPGRSLCVLNQDCGDVALGTLSVTVDGATVEVDYGGRAEIGAYRVLHAGDEHELSAADCADWYAAHTAVLVERR